MNVPRSNDNHTPEDRTEGESETTRGGSDENGLDRLEAFLQLAILMNDPVAKNTNAFETPKPRTPQDTNVDTILSEMQALNDLVSNGNTEAIKNVIRHLIESGPSSSPGFDAPSRVARLAEYKRIAREQVSKMAAL
jgi:hypothetical protein